MKIAIVTGASSGMGREIAYQIGDRFSGIDEIWVAARRGERLWEMSGQIPARVRCFSVDVTEPAGREEIAAALREEKPEVKFLVNAAGCGVIGRVGRIPDEAERRMVRLNCEALCAVTSMVLPYMGRNSRILQFASASAFLPQPDFAVYAATKAFVLSYSRALGAELRDRRIYVTAVCPGPVKTEFFDTAQQVEPVAAYKKWFMADPKKVAAKALRDSMAGRAVSVYGISMNLFRFAVKVVPHGVILRAMGKQGKDRDGDEKTKG